MDSHESLEEQALRLANGDKLMTPGEVAHIFRVDPKTVTRWSLKGRLPALRTPGGHKRFWRSDVAKLLEGEESS